LAKTSPLESVEPLLVQYCRKLVNIGSPLCKDQVISLMESLIENTLHYNRLVAFKKRLKLQLPCLEDDESVVLGH
jgi:hypothetical protein